MHKIGDRLYFMEVLTQLHDATNRLSKSVGTLASSRSLPNLQRAGLPLEVVSKGSHSATPPTAPSAQCPLTPRHCVHLRWVDLLLCPSGQAALMGQPAWMNEQVRQWTKAH